VVIFFYTDDEFELMKKDVNLCKELGCNGVVIGILNKDGSVDKKKCSALVELAYPLGVTFHRAFDRASNVFQALEDIIEIGCERILTSGQQPNVVEGITVIKELIVKADDRVIIMPGAGLRSENVKELALETAAVEFHTTAKRNEKSQMQFINDHMKETLEYVIVDEIEVRNISQILLEL